MAREGLFDDSGYQGFEECSRYEECSKECFEKFMNDENIPNQLLEMGYNKGIEMAAEKLENAFECDVCPAKEMCGWGRPCKDTLIKYLKNREVVDG